MSNLGVANNGYEHDESVVFFEELYEIVKYNPNEVWEIYEDKIKKIINGLSYWKNFSKDELLQQSYIYFVDFCQIYDPYYNDGFIPFDKFLFKNLIMKLRAYIQRYYFKSRREQPSEFLEYVSKNNINETDDKMHSEYIYSLITKRQREILDLSIQGYKQQEIGEILGVSQSRVSVIRKKCLAHLSEVLNAKDLKERKKQKK